MIEAGYRSGTSSCNTKGLAIPSAKRILLGVMSALSRALKFLLAHLVVQISTLCMSFMLLSSWLLVLLRGHILSLVHLLLGLLLNLVADLLLLDLKLSLLKGENMRDLLLYEFQDFLSLGFVWRVNFREKTDHLLALWKGLVLKAE